MGRERERGRGKGSGTSQTADPSERRQDNNMTPAEIVKRMTPANACV
jgi:hypothetical protein